MPYINNGEVFKETPPFQRTIVFLSKYEHISIINQYHEDTGT